MTATLIAPSGVTGTVQSGGASYDIGADGTIAVPNNLVGDLLNAGFRFYTLVQAMALFVAPFVADLVSIKAAATPANGAISIVKQPDYARKLQVRVVIGTTTTTAITAGSLTLVGKDVNGDALTEVVSLIMAASATLVTTNAFASITSGTVADYAASGSGTGNTLGIGVAADLAVAMPSAGVNLAVNKATKIVHTYTGSGTAVTTVAVIAADDVAATCTVDAAAGTIAPTTAAGATATTSTDFAFLYEYGVAA